ncbi:MAG: hypothetical protein ACLQPH_02230 [Acidimicrobiales bacterium]
MTSIDAPFPSDEWFADLVRRATADPEALQRLGTAEFCLGIEVLDEDGGGLFGMVLDGYDVFSAGRVDEEEFRPDVVISGPLAVWREMVDAIEVHGGADTAHTLNTLTLAGVPLAVRAADPMGHDKFFRYMGTLQAIFDAAGSPATAVGSVP